MNQPLTYQQLFQSLKGVQIPTLNSLVLPVPDTGYVLSPINCTPQGINLEVVEILTNGRNANTDSFLTFFEATVPRTKSWLTNVVAQDDRRLLFTVKNVLTGDIYGYMGLAYGNEDGSYIEADAIVRTAHRAVPGLMKMSFQRMLHWIQFEVGISSVWVRVLSDNSAIAFYQKSHFEIQTVKPLYEVYDAAKNLVELSPESANGSRKKSQRSLSYMSLKR